ncbi:MAG: VWA domain-containing protein [Acidobacteria bacterium]|nr:VWA domain-containing protein [Acidobacteriota bacterium]
MKYFASLIVATAAIFVFSGGIRAQGVVVPIICEFRPCRPIPRPMPVPLPNALPVKSIELDTRIEGQIATTHLVQVFRNDTPYTLEGTYFFPIPESASIIEFAIWENGKKLVGEVRSREEARRIYDEIVRRQRDPGLLEYAGKDLFQASIFPIPPNSDKKLELKYSQVLKAESGTVAYRYPLGTGRNLWRQSPDEVSRRNMPTQKFGTVSGKIEIVGREALRNIYSPSHQVDVKRRGETSATVSFETSNNDNDFQLFYGLSSNDFGLSLLTYREPGKDGFFLLQLSPKDNLSERELINKDIIFVLDTSGSMADNAGTGAKGGTKLEKARNALNFGIQTLREGDRFNVINFAGEEHLMESGLIAANAEGKRRGAEFVNRLTPNGGTNINDALRAAMRQFDSSDRPKMLVFMTDGLPTIGEQNVDQIIKNAAEIKVDGLRLFNFGVGYDVNTTLLDKLAAQNGGTADYVEPSEDLEVKVSNFFAKVSSPVLTDLELDFGGVQTDLMYPRKLTDIFKGTQLTVIGRYRNVNDLNNIVLKLRGKAGRETRTFEYRNLDFPVRADKNDFLPRLWATRRVGWLIEQIRANGDNKELRDEIVDLGTRFGIVTPYTSYLATDGSENQTLVRQQQVPTPTAKTRIADSSGRGAVLASKDAKEKQEAVSVIDDEDKVSRESRRTMKKVSVKTFYLENGVWTDGEFKESARLPETKLRFMSAEYFDLLASDKELAQYLSLGEEVVVVWKGRLYRITK